MFLSRYVAWFQSLLEDIFLFQNFFMSLNLKMNVIQISPLKKKQTLLIWEENTPLQIYTHQLKKNNNNQVHICIPSAQKKNIQ